MDTERIISIRKRNPDIALAAFDELMSRTENWLNEKAKLEPSSFRTLSPLQLEDISLQAMKTVCSSTPFLPKDIVLVSGQSFPDIVAASFYGVEVKSTHKDYWKSTGSSIIENTRVNNVESIYMLFGKLGGNPEFKCRPYQDCLYDITVTHSPRYLIDMTISETDTIFSKMGIPYDELRLSSHSIANVRKYYRQKAISNNQKEMPWWIDENPDGNQGMMLKFWSNIPPDYKVQIKKQMLLLFPQQIIEKDYSDAALWLVAYHKIVCPNIRDLFSSGGQAKYLNRERLACPVPAIVKRLLDIAQSSDDLFVENLALIELYNPSIAKSNSIIDAWINQVDTALSSKYGQHIKFKEWYRNRDILNL